MKHSASPLLKMSFETTCTFLIDATAGADSDNLESPSARLILGRPVCLVLSFTAPPCPRTPYTQASTHQRPHTHTTHTLTCTCLTSLPYMSPHISDPPGQDWHGLL